MGKVILNIGIFIVILFLSSCGGGGGSTPAATPQPTVPVTPKPSQSELYIGYYTESSIADKNDPTPRCVVFIFARC